MMESNNRHIHTHASIRPPRINVCACNATANPTTPFHSCLSYLLLLLLGRRATSRVGLASVLGLFRVRDNDGLGAVLFFFVVFVGGWIYEWMMIGYASASGEASWSGLTSTHPFTQKPINTEYRIITASVYIFYLDEKVGHLLVPVAHRQHVGRLPKQVPVVVVAIVVWCHVMSG